MTTTLSYGSSLIHVTLQMCCVKRERKREREMVVDESESPAFTKESPDVE